MAAISLYRFLVIHSMRVIYKKFLNIKFVQNYISIKKTIHIHEYFKSLLNEYNEYSLIMVVLYESRFYKKHEYGSIRVIKITSRIYEISRTVLEGYQ